MALVTIIFVIINILVSIFSIRMAWCFMFVPLVFFTGMLRLVKRKEWEPPNNLSPQAFQHFKSHPHFYSMPLAAMDFGSACAQIQFLGILLSMIAAYRNQYWLAALCIPNWIWAGTLSLGFRPVPKFNADEIALHNEIMGRLH